MKKIFILKTNFGEGEPPHLPQPRPTMYNIIKIVIHLTMLMTILALILNSSNSDF